MPRCSVLVAVTIGAGAVIAAFAGTRVLAQQDQTFAPDIRPALDDTETPARPNGLRKRAQTPDTRPVGGFPTYGIPTGTGTTGFVSSLRRQLKTKGKPKNGVAAPLQLSGTPDSPTAPPPPLAPLPDSARKAQANAAKQPAAPVAAPPTTQLVAPTPQLVPTTAPELVPPDPQLVANPTPPYVPPQLRKPAAAADQDAFEQIGIRVGAFLVKPAIEVSEGYNTNPAAIPGGIGSWFTAISPELNVQSQWQRHELTATIRGTFTEYDSVSSQDRPFLDAKVNGRIDVTDRTQINLEARYLISTDFPGSPNLPAGLAKQPPFTDIGTTIGVTQRWNRFEVALKGLYDRFDYDNAELLDGSTLSQKDRDYNQYGGQLRSSYELTPGIKPFVEGDADTRVHDLPVDLEGEQRDSHGVSGKVGTTFELSRMLTGDISVGYLTRVYKDPTLPDINALLFDASLTWTATGLTTAKFAASTKVDETTLIGVSGILRRDYQVQVDHAFRRWLIGTLKFDYENDDYVGSTRVDNRYVASAALIYKLSRAWQVKSEVREEWLRSNTAGVDYNATIATLGLRWQP